MPNTDGIHFPIQPFEDTTVFDQRAETHARELLSSLRHYKYELQGASVQTLDALHEALTELATYVGDGLDFVKETQATAHELKEGYEVRDDACNDEAFQFAEETIEGRTSDLEEALKGENASWLGVAS